MSEASKTSIRDTKDASWKDLADQNQKLNGGERSEGRSVLNSLPYQVQIGADNRCNLRCRSRCIYLDL